MAEEQISLTKTGMVFVITDRMPSKEKEIPMVVEWVASTVMARVKEIVAETEMETEMDAVTNTEMVGEIKIHPLLTL